MRNKPLENKAHVAALRIRSQLGIKEAPAIGLVLGTGWGDAITFDDAREIPFGHITGFEDLAQLEGHARRVVYGKLGGVPVIALRGRVHLNERPNDPALAMMVRLQTEMLLQMGVKTLIVTCAAGALSKDGKHGLSVGGICVVDGFVTLYAPEMPLVAGEFCSPEDTLDERLQRIACDLAFGSGYELSASCGGHVMVRGPFFEGRKYDKQLLANTGASVVGMSLLPEACVAALYPGVKVLGLAFITNGMLEEHSHEENVKRAKEKSAKLGAYLARIVRDIEGSTA